MAQLLTKIVKPAPPRKADPLLPFWLLVMLLALCALDFVSWHEVHKIASR